jgi:hypothetical protein
MKLTVFSAENFPPGPEMGGGILAHAKITFAKTGKIIFSKPAAAHMALSAKDRIAFAQDHDDPGNWFVFLDANGFQLQDGKRGSLVLEHSELIKAYIDTWDLKAGVNYRAALGAEPRMIRKKKHWLLQLQDQPGTEAPAEE